MKNIRIQVLAVLVLALLASHAQAQFVVKRVKCEDTVSAELGAGYPTIPFHRNQSGSTKTLSVQIIRDTCRPRKADGRFRVTEASTSSTYGINFMIRTTAYPASVTMEIESGRFGVVRFQPLIDGRVSGNFDYMYSWE